MKENNKFVIKVPEEQQENTKNNSEKTIHIKKIKESIEAQYIEIIEYQDIQITEENKRDMERIILATEDLIGNCMLDDYYSGNRDANFVNLTFICHKISLRMETYKLEEKIKELNEKNNDINKKQQEIEDRNNNLVYNMLGFLTSFSIVSAVVGVIDKIDGILTLMLFIAFTILILLTTLIALHNFYKNDNKRESKLQDNYFLWKVVAFIMGFLILMIALNNKDKIDNWIHNENNSTEIIENNIEEEN